MLTLITLSLIAELYATEARRTARGAHWQNGKAFFFVIEPILNIHSMFVQTRDDVGKRIIDSGVCVCDDLSDIVWKGLYK